MLSIPHLKITINPTYIYFWRKNNVPMTYNSYFIKLNPFGLNQPQTHHLLVWMILIQSEKGYAGQLAAQVSTYLLGLIAFKSNNTIFYFRYFDRYIVISHCGFKFHFHNACDAKHSFIEHCFFLIQDTSEVPYTMYMLCTYQL